MQTGISYQIPTEHPLTSSISLDGIPVTDQLAWKSRHLHFIKILIRNFVRLMEHGTLL